MKQKLPENNEKYFFDQRLRSAASICRLKYSTNVLKTSTFYQAVPQANIYFTKNEAAAVSFLRDAWVWLGRIVPNRERTGLGTGFIV